jgi:hypothetical protein
MITETNERWYCQCERCGFVGLSAGYADEKSATNALNRHTCKAGPPGIDDGPIASADAGSTNDDVFTQVLTGYGVSDKIIPRIVWLFRMNQKYQREPGALANMLAGQGITLNKSRQIVDEFFGMAVTPGYQPYGPAGPMPMQVPGTYQPFIQSGGYMYPQMYPQQFPTGPYCNVPYPMPYQQYPMIYQNPRGPPVVVEKRVTKVPIVVDGQHQVDTKTGEPLYQVVEEPITAIPTQMPTPPGFVEFAETIAKMKDILIPQGPQGDDPQLIEAKQKLAAMETKLDDEREKRHQAEMDKIVKENEKNTAMLIKVIEDLKGRIIDPFDALEAFEMRARKLGYGKEITGKTVIDLMDSFRKDMHEGMTTIAGRVRTGKAKEERPRRTPEERQAAIARMTGGVEGASRAAQMENDMLTMTADGTVRAYVPKQGA